MSLRYCSSVLVVLCQFKTALHPSGYVACCLVQVTPSEPHSEEALLVLANLASPVELVLPHVSSTFALCSGITIFLQLVLHVSSMMLLEVTSPG
jgi:hypothetical protein